MAGAAFKHDLSWRSINWKKAHKDVDRLQTRIVKAVQEGKRRKVRSLQHILTRSLGGSAIAVKRVTENQGKQTPGIDHIIWRTPAQKVKALRDIRKGQYCASPLRRVYISKSNGQKRPLGIPTMKDRAKQALYLLALDPIAECLADPNSYGFRRGRSTADAIEQCFKVLARKRSARWILEGDIQGCFDNINHEWLLSHIPINKKVLAQWLKGGLIDHQTFKKTEAGTPQGGIISPVIANMALDGLELKLKIRFKGQKVHLVRYADDFIITGTNQETLIYEVKPFVEEFLAERGLSLSVDKTRITSIETGFDFLGQTIRKYKDKCQITPSKRNVTTFLSKLRNIIQENKAAKVGSLIMQLNPLLRGWANYHRAIKSYQVFSKVDDQLWRKLWPWAKRRHHNKSREWILNRYFKPHQGRRWVLSGKTNEGKQAYLIRLTTLPRGKHIKVRSLYNPYDPLYKSYFNRRLRQNWEEGKEGKARLCKLWLLQQGQCLICKTPITDTTGWNIHHKVSRNNGGEHSRHNMVLLHPTCHQQYHAYEKTKVHRVSKAL